MNQYTPEVRDTGDTLNELQKGSGIYPLIMITLEKFRTAYMLHAVITGSAVITLRDFMNTD
jgi:hypothetical protein